MSKLQIYRAELEVGYNKPVLNKEDYGIEELLYAYHDNTDRMIMITKNGKGKILLREFFHDYTVTQGVNGDPIVSSTIFANIECIKITDMMDRIIQYSTIENGMIDILRLKYSLSELNIAKNSVNLNNDIIQVLDSASYRLLESFYLKEPYMSVSATADKLKLEEEIENLSKDSKKRK